MDTVLLAALGQDQHILQPQINAPFEKLHA